jgi:regulator of protease activity HflC (stomatin/prohibitin superfamily)
MRSNFPRLPAKLLLPVAALVLVVVVSGYVWFVQRVEVPANQVLVLIHKTGDLLPDQASGQVVLYPALLERLGEAADSTRFKGIVYNVRTEGRYFYDPLFWKAELKPATVVGPGEVGVLIRRYGEPLPTGKIVATDPHERGPLAELLPQGRHNINPYAYEVIRVNRLAIPEGSVGVQTFYGGSDPADPNQYVVAEGERGVQPDVLPPGLYNINPFLKRVDIIDVRSHTLDLRGAEAIRFPSKDSFEILVEGTVEYAIRIDKVPYVMTAIGDHPDIKDKLILPYMRSFARIEGSKLEAREFISGDTRKAFQDRVFEGLREECFAQGIEIRATLIRRIDPPGEIAGPISERQIADQKIQQLENEIKLAESEARLAEETERQKQNREVGEAQREVVGVVKEAEQRKSVALLDADQRLAVAKIQLDAAKEEAAALTARGEADATVALLEFEAEARPLSEAVSAFGDGAAYAQFFFYEKLSPALKSILASTDGPFAEIFKSLATPAEARPFSPAEPREGQSDEASQAKGVEGS